MKCCLRPLALVAVPSRIKVNYHILFLTGHHLLAGEHTRTHTYTHTLPLKDTYSQTIQENCVSVSYVEVMLHVLV